MWPPSYGGEVQSGIWFEMVLGPFKIKAEGAQAEGPLGENSLKPIFRLGVAYAFDPCTPGTDEPGLQSESIS